ncbi:hypothetical protein [Nostoc sp. C117]|uniref:hypothetical protein n=1 Tax=Nostoc sp. C117 TaxID=3349875 RepID=UPI00370D3F89
MTRKPTFVTRKPAFVTRKPTFATRKPAFATPIGLTQTIAEKSDFLVEAIYELPPTACIFA